MLPWHVDSVCKIMSWLRRYATWSPKPVRINVGFLFFFFLLSPNHLAYWLSLTSWYWKSCSGTVCTVFYCPLLLQSEILADVTQTIASLNRSMHKFKWWVKRFEILKCRGKECECHPTEAIVVFLFFNFCTTAPSKTLKPITIRAVGERCSMTYPEHIMLLRYSDVA